METSLGSKYIPYTYMDPLGFCSPALGIMFVIGQDQGI